MHRSESRPIDNIPDELLSQIFQEYLEINDTRDNLRDLPEGTIASYKARVHICSINHRMREVAIQSPQLWTYIQLPVNLQGYPPIPLLKLWIERFGNTLPIYVDFYPGDLVHSHKISNTQHEGDAIKLLRPHLHRWKSLKLCLDHPNTRALSTLPLAAAETLEKFEAACYDDQDASDKLLANIAKLPALRHLVWYRYHVGEGHKPSFRIAVTNFPWQQLRSISLSVMMSPSETLQVLSASTSAVVICLEVRRDPSSPIDLMRRPLVTLPQLRCLDIRSDVGIYETLQYLDLPGLKGFRLLTSRFHSTGQNVTVTQYQDFISRVSSSLEYLILDGFDFVGGDVYSFFSNPRLLTPPVARFCTWGDEVLKAVVEGLRSGMRTRLDVKRSLIVRESTFFIPHYIGWLREGGEGLEEVGMDLGLPRIYYDVMTWADH